MLFLWYYLTYGRVTKTVWQHLLQNLFTLKLPGEFFSSSSVNASAPKFLQSLRRHVRVLKPVPASRDSPYPVFISKKLFHSSCVFHRVQKPPEPPTLVHTR
ncbi:hypothetical protein NPIL_436321 [Nephila pilipes]|uniref:Uncharacterized protein n=1 Tax=Nephila pilipes TaxID=299642 RepID=A0A8X6TJE1_NEPPI|nr:hypothetical protein NPIL_436321 [Nephila pilipes]